MSISTSQSAFMARWRVSICLIMLSLSVSHAFAQDGDVQVGDSEEVVVSVLGRPQGKARTRGVDIFYYGRGTVETKDGKVIQVNLVSEQEAKAIKKERERREEETRLASEAERVRLIEEGMAEKERTLYDPEYTNMTAQEIVTYWDTFRSEYPNVAIDAGVYRAAQQELQAEKEAARKRAEAIKAAEKPPKPRISGKKKKKMKRAGKWIWD